MEKRFVAIWFRYLLTDRLVRHQPALKNMPLVLAAASHGRMLVSKANNVAISQGVYPNMTVADARAIVPSLQVFDEDPGQPAKLLEALATWCIRYTPVTAIDLPDGLLLDATGCAHLWGGETAYLGDITKRLNQFGYHTRMAIAGTIGTAWAVSRFGQPGTIIQPGEAAASIAHLPPEALRIEPAVFEKLHKLGLNKIGHFISMPRSALRRRFGAGLLYRLDQALGFEPEHIEPVQPVEIHRERLVCFEPIKTATGIEIALKQLLDQLCRRLQKEEKGLRKAVLKCHRLDGKIEQISIGTNSPSHSTMHLFKLFALKIPAIEPDLGIELFLLEAPVVEDIAAIQQSCWSDSGGLQDTRIAELLDRISSRIGPGCISRYLPDEHYWPERSIKKATSLEEQPTTAWPHDLKRPIILLKQPQPIEVMAPIPDYPPMQFQYNGELHKITKADGPERIEREWWLECGQPRDYYCVEDEQGRRYWLFRSGHYQADQKPGWFIHGFFA